MSHAVWLHATDGELAHRRQLGAHTQYGEAVLTR